MATVTNIYSMTFDALLLSRLLQGCLAGWTDGRMDGWMDGWLDGVDGSAIYKRSEKGQ